jgi:hypothetical protein
MSYETYSEPFLFSALIVDHMRMLYLAFAHKLYLNQLLYIGWPPSDKHITSNQKPYGPTIPSSS